MLLLMPSTRDRFAIHGASFAALGSFAVGDLGIIVLGSVLVVLWGGQGSAVHAAWLVAGALLYGTCYVVTTAITGVSSALGASLMIPASLASIVASVILTRDANACCIPPGSAA